MRIGRGLPREQTLVVRRICPIRIVVCASQAYLDARGTPRIPDDLAAHECLGYTAPPEVWNFPGQTVKTHSSLNIDNGDGLLAACLAGHGITYLPTFLVGDAIREGRLVRILEGFDQEPGVAYAAYPETQHLSPKVRAFIDWLVESIGPEPAWDEGL